MATATAFTLHNVRGMLDIGRSKIGANYPRIFIEVSAHHLYLNVDLTIGHVFDMKEKDWDDWMSDAYPAAHDELKDILQDVGIPYILLDEMFKHVVEDYNA